jgi:hypothetical protein
MSPIFIKDVETLSHAWQVEHLICPLELRLCLHISSGEPNVASREQLIPFALLLLLLNDTFHHYPNAKEPSETTTTLFTLGMR